VYKQEIRFSYEVLPAVRRRLGKYNVLLNQGVSTAMRRARPDVTLCGGYSYVASWQAARWAKDAGIPFLLWVESTARDRRAGHTVVETLKRRFLRYCTGFVVPGKSSREYLLHLGITDHIIFKAPNAIDNDFFRSRAEDARRTARERRKQLGLPARYFLHVGRLVGAKGVFDLLEAYAKLDTKIRSEVALVFVGDGAVRRELEARARDISPGLVEFRGFLQREDLPAFYALAEALVFPTHTDPWGFVVNEAMACGVAVIATDVPGCVADLVVDSSTGLVVPAHNVSCLKHAMVELASDPERVMLMRRHAVLKISEYSPKAWAAGVASAVAAVRGSS
jgi:glycosyltransferase involved in cell wall biosynthesis